MPMYQSTNRKMLNCKELRQKRNGDAFKDLQKN